MDLLELTQTHPGAAAAATAMAAGCVPVFKALRRAAVRRIDQAWPDDRPELTHAQKVEHTVQKLSTSVIPDAVVASAVRGRKKD